MIKEKSIVVLMPTYNDWESVLQLLPRIDDEFSKLGVSGRVVVVDDGSSDIGQRDAIKNLSFAVITSVTAVDLHRNLGNQRAIAIGIAHCAENEQADYLVIMDSDQEDSPEYIPKLIEACDENGNLKIIFAERSKRSEGILFSFFYGAYQRLYKILTGMPISIGNFSVVPRALIKRTANIAELWSHYPASIMRARLLFDSIPSARGKRSIGKSKMSLVPLLLHALSGFTVHAEIVGVRVLVMAVVLGLAVLGLLAVAIGLKVFSDIPILGWTSQIVGLLAVLLFQLVVTMVIMVFMVISVRMQVPMIPILEYMKFITQVADLYPSGATEG